MDLNSQKRQSSGFYGELGKSGSVIVGAIGLTGALARILENSFFEAAAFLVAAALAFGLLAVAVHRH